MQHIPLLFGITNLGTSNHTKSPQALDPKIINEWLWDSISQHYQSSVYRKRNYYSGTQDSFREDVAEKTVQQTAVGSFCHSVMDTEWVRNGEMDISWFVGTLLSNLVLLPDRGVDVTAADIVKPQIECRRRQVTLGAGERMLGIPYPTLIKGRGMLTGDIVQTPTPRFRGTYFWVHKYQIWATTYCIGQMGRVWQRLLDQCLNFAP